MWNTLFKSRIYSLMKMEFQFRIKYLAKILLLLLVMPLWCLRRNAGRPAAWREVGYLVPCPRHRSVTWYKHLSPGFDNASWEIPSNLFSAQTQSTGTVVSDHYLKFSKDLAQQSGKKKPTDQSAQSPADALRSKQQKLNWFSLWWPLNLGYAPLISWSNGEVNFHEKWWIGELRRWVIFHSSIWLWL